MKNLILSIPCAFLVLAAPAAYSQEATAPETPDAVSVETPTPEQAEPAVVQDESAEEVAAPTLVTIDAADVALADFKWSNRVLVVFADSPLDPSFRQQIELLSDRPEVLTERDVVVLTDTDPDALSAVRKALRPRGFALVIVDKDSRVMLRKPAPWDLREITHAIDKTPLRQQEILEAKEAAKARE